jgi:hypothetical protein
VIARPAALGHKQSPKLYHSNVCLRALSGRSKPANRGIFLVLAQFLERRQLTLPLDLPYVFLVLNRIRNLPRPMVGKDQASRVGGNGRPDPVQTAVL